MLVRNYMHPHPMTIDSDTLVSEAKRLISENNLHALAGGRGVTACVAW
jgi:CBS domain-containing protein